jgi:hypothetical protein
VVGAVGEVLPAAVGVALSPFPIVAVVMVLDSSRAAVKGAAFALGWMVGLATLTAIVVVLAGGADDPSSDASAIVSWLRVLAGVGLLLLAVKTWRDRPRDGVEPKVPRWMASLDDLGPPRALVLGAALGGANPKNLALTFAAASSIAAAGLTGSDAAVAGGLYVVLASSTVLGLLVAYLALGPRAAAPLGAIKEFMAANNASIMMVILLILGAKILGDGLAGI